MPDLCLCVEFAQVSYTVVSIHTSVWASLFNYTAKKSSFDNMSTYKCHQIFELLCRKRITKIILKFCRSVKRRWRLTTNQRSLIKSTSIWYKFFSSDKPWKCERSGAGSTVSKPAKTSKENKAKV